MFHDVSWLKLRSGFFRSTDEPPTLASVISPVAGQRFVQILPLRLLLQATSRASLLELFSNHSGTPWGQPWSCLGRAQCPFSTLGCGLMLPTPYKMVVSLPFHWCQYPWQPHDPMIHWSGTFVVSSRSFAVIHPVVKKSLSLYHCTRQGLAWASNRDAWLFTRGYNDQTKYFRIDCDDIKSFRRCLHITIHPLGMVQELIFRMNTTWSHPDLDPSGLTRNILVPPHAVLGQPCLASWCAELTTKKLHGTEYLWGHISVAGEFGFPEWMSNSHVSSYSDTEDLMIQLNG